MKKTAGLILFILLVLFAAGCADNNNNNNNVGDAVLSVPPHSGNYADNVPPHSGGYADNAAPWTPRNDGPEYILLPSPQTDGEISVEKALANRRSHRGFQDRALSKEQLSQLLWAAYGITSPERGLRTAPSAGALYPLEIYAIAGSVDGIDPGVYKYISEEHKLVRIIDGDVRRELAEAALDQRMIAAAPAAVFYSAVFDRITGRYGDRGIMYAYMEAGHSAQNVYLQAEAMGLGTCAVGAFTGDRVREILNLAANEEPLYLMPVGYYYN
jgi:SagB-type dehydrogenase family enzyme